MQWPELSTFCLFVGYGRSGHSAIGSVIDAHPNAVVSHELHALKRFSEGVTRSQLFTEIYERSQTQAAEGRTSSRADGGVYHHVIEGQRKNGNTGVTTLGDKKGAGTTHHISTHGLQILEDFESFLGVPLKILHVIRNPFDVIAAGKARGHSGFLETVPLVQRIREYRQGEGWLDVYHEEVLAAPDEQIARILSFLSLPVIEQHLAACRAYLFDAPTRRRQSIDWQTDERRAVEDLIARVDYLQHYTLDA